MLLMFIAQAMKPITKVKIRIYIKLKNPEKFKNSIFCRVRVI